MGQEEKSQIWHCESMRLNLLLCQERKNEAICILSDLLIRVKVKKKTSASFPTMLHIHNVDHIYANLNV
jgi:hypothetical protein